MLTTLQHFARYNQRMNTQVFDAAAALTDEVRKNDLGAFFGSIHNTLNHILVGDIFWLNRFRKMDEANFTHLKPLMEFPIPASLRDVLYDDFDELHANRRVMDFMIRNWLEQDITTTHLNTALSYKTSSGEQFNKPFSELLSHLFNHQTHHRGQISTLLFQQGIDIGPTDFVFDIPNIQ